MMSITWFRRGALLALLLVFIPHVSLAKEAADAEYRLAVGDVVEVSVAGLPDLRHTASINVDGKASFPLVGALRAAGLTINELQAAVRDQMPKKNLRQRTEGREFIVVLDPQEIVLRIHEYRPVYVSGDVARPGALTFRPGMTVRQLIALGGGIGSARGTGPESLLMTTDLRAQYQATASEVAIERTRIARIEAELGSEPPSFQELLSDLRLSQEAQAQIAKNEAEQLRVRQSELGRESVHLERLGHQLEERLGLLKKQRDQEEEGVKLDMADWERVRNLFDKGMVPVTRLSDARRSVLLSSTRKLQTDAEVMQVERLQEEIRRKLEKLHEERRSQLLADLQEAKARAAGLEAKLAATREKLALIGDAAPMLGDNKAKLDIRIFRTGETSEETISADESTPLAPGDVVQIALPVESYTAQVMR